MSASGKANADESSESSSFQSFLDKIETPLTNQVMRPHSTMHRLNSQVSLLTEPDLQDELHDQGLTGVTSLVNASRFTDDRSVDSNYSRSSVLSERIHKASRRGGERASARSVASDEGKKKKKKSSKKSIRGLDLAAVVKQKAEMLSPGRESGRNGAVLDMSVLLERDKDRGRSEGIVDMSALLEQKSRVQSDERSKKSKGSRSHRSKHSSSGMSLGSELNPNKYTDQEYLIKSAINKFGKGVSLLKKGKFQMAREY